ncbi:leucine-rich repeat transmembrane protein kinase family protein [Perilla frutescens var. hirtella]|uniref:Leucine-rich repeat transmembrane protein kinase family protein n=1 Tax=Perilla frutescens var. hirtella TaxID=608512 RepID=A0AAD4JLJ7_PERFH|nr:leucine-rich repeat transmembrane protein kinase family protein [Perilla frutescens var. hirtella]
MLKRVFFSALNLFVLMFYIQLVSSQLPSDQVSVMTSIYEIIQNNTGSSFVWNNVLKSSSPCSWKGVVCSPDNSSIINISFNSFSVSTSEFLPFLCNISTLESLDVSHNQLSSIPEGFYTGCGETSELKLLNFSGNELKGSLPSFNGFTVLENLDLSRNSLSGEISQQLDGLGSLKSLDLSWNQFTGKIPTNLGKMNLLEEIVLSANSFRGEIPVEMITKYSNLRVIDLSANQLSGSIPRELGELTSLQTLLLSANHLSGGIPASLTNITTLRRFAANQNGFNGTIPSGITSYLAFLDLSYNELTGTIPSDLLSGPNLQALDLSSNKLEGSIPAINSTKLFRLRLGSNSLNGTIPSDSLGSLVELMYLELDGNSISGGIPSELGMLRKLALLNLAQNRLAGVLPPELGDLINIQVLSLQSNNFVGVIPPEILQLNKLEKLNMSKNLLNGSIPLSISRMQNLRNLDLQGNNLHGPIPDSIGNLSSLIELQLGNNQLSGRIPIMPEKLQIALNLSYNLFDGSIPSSLSRLQGLEVLDLSNNRFSGEIPDFLTGLDSLTHLLLMNNELSGIFPVFRNHVVVDTTGNNQLVYPNRNPSPSNPRRSKSIASTIVIAVASAAMAVGLFIMIGVFVSRRYQRVNDEHPLSAEEASPPQVVHGNLLTSNVIHKSNIDFKTAMEAVADPSKITLKTRFSTYYKAVMPSGASYFVKKLNWSDKIFQLGSHERFEEELEVLGKLCSSNVMIPLAYVLTVDSAYLFYDFAPKGTLFDVLHRMGGTLDWASRYSIAIGVSQGLAFLHECKSSPILLLDLSSKTILLKSLNEPQVGDIELCKVIDPSKSTGSLSTIAGSVGYVPPEYAYTMRVTAAGNVYSFGVVLLELLTGKPAVSGGIELAKWVLSNSAQRNRWDQILDFNISKTSVAVRSQMLAVLKVAIACVNLSPETRPKMKSVLRMLLNAR